MILRSSQLHPSPASWRDRGLLRVALFCDGRPGHEKQSRGIIQALAGMVAVEVVTVDVSALSPLKRIIQLLALLSPLSWRGEAYPPADLLLGAGSRSHLAMLLAKKAQGAPAVVCMSPLAFLRRRCDLCLVPVHDGLSEGGNVFCTLGAPNCSVDLRRHRHDCGLIALGGVDRRSHSWHSEEMIAMAGELVERERQMHWTLTSSPRTPEETARGLARLAELHNHVEFFDYRHTARGWIEERYVDSATVWVSADSISMVYEALSAGCRVGLLPVRWERGAAKFRRNEELLLHRGLVLPFARWRVGEGWQETDQYFNEAQRCAERILRIWQANA